MCDRVRDQTHELFEREGLRSDRIEHHIVFAATSSDRDRGNVVHMNRPDSVVTGAGDSEDWQSSQQPRDVVDQDVTAAEQHRRPNDSVPQRRFHHQLLGARLPGEVRKRRRLGVGDAEMHDPAGAGFNR